MHYGTASGRQAREGSTTGAVRRIHVQFVLATLGCILMLSASHVVRADLTSGPGAVQPAGAQSSADTEKERTEVQNAWAAARVNGDAAFLERFYAKEFQIINAGGSVVERATDIELFATRAIKPEYIRDEDMRFLVYGRVTDISDAAQRRFMAFCRQIRKAASRRHPWHLSVAPFR
jgi:hypothetical protein